MRLPSLTAAPLIARANPAGADRRVLAEQVKSLYAQLPMVLAGTAIGCFVIAAVLWGEVPAWLLGGWLAVVLANVAFRMAVYARFSRSRIEPQDASRWCNLWLLGAALSGTLFGFAGVAFVVPESMFHQVALTLVIFLMCAGAVPLLATYLPSLFTFLLPALVPLIARLALEGGTGLFIAFTLAVSMVFMIILGLHYGRVIVESITVRFQNLDLIDALSEQTRLAEAARASAEQARAAAEEARQAAEIANRSKTRFFAAASHDLRQPLHAMGLFAAALEEKVTDPGVAGVVKSIGASVESLETLFNELLDISKIDAGVVRPNPRVFALQALFDRLRRDQEPEAHHKGLTLRFVPTGHAVDTDPMLLERIVRNLVANAIRYTVAGGIVVGARRRGDRISIEVWDSGIGIAPADRERVFEEFYQIDNPERDRRKGLGLGLSIVNRLSALLEAPVELVSRPGRGTIFKVSLPRAARSPAAAAAPGAPAPGPSDVAGKTIIVIDDEPSVLEGMAALLTGWGATPVLAASAADALARAGAVAHAPDLLIVDYRLRDGAIGLDAIAALRERFGTGLPAIVVTGSSTPDLAEAAAAVGANLLAKPVSPAKLRALVQAKLRGAAARA